MKQFILISTGAELLRIPADNLVYVEAYGNSSFVATMDGRKTPVSMQLGKIEDIMAAQLGDAGSNFIRLGRSLVINADYIFSIDTTLKTLVLSDGKRFSYELSASREALVKFKKYIEEVTLCYGESAE